MKERPILFKDEMVRALLDGSKTQTRRIAKLNAAGRVQLGKHQWHVQDDFAYGACPYGLKGDQLWVRETFCIGWPTGVDGEWSAIRYSGCPESERKAFYKADMPDDPFSPQRYWKPSIHMPRWASRITLEVVNVRVERLHDISPSDCSYEGIEVPLDIDGGDVDRQYELVGYYRKLWESINGQGSWDANPWVWVIEFKRLQ